MYTGYFDGTNYNVDIETAWADDDIRFSSDVGSAVIIYHCTAYPLPPFLVKVPNKEIIKLPTGGCVVHLTWTPDKMCTLHRV